MWHNQRDTNMSRLSAQSWCRHHRSTPLVYRGCQVGDNLHGHCSHIGLLIHTLALYSTHSTSPRGCNGSRVTDMRAAYSRGARKAPRLLSWRCMIHNPWTGSHVVNRQQGRLRHTALLIPMSIRHLIPSTSQKGLSGFQATNMLANRLIHTNSAHTSLIHFQSQRHPSTQQLSRGFRLPSIDKEGWSGHQGHTVLSYLKSMTPKASIGLQAFSSQHEDCHHIYLSPLSPIRFRLRHHLTRQRLNGCRLPNIDKGSYRERAAQPSWSFLMSMIRRRLNGLAVVSLRQDQLSGVVKSFTSWIPRRQHQRSLIRPHFHGLSILQEIDWCVEQARRFGLLMRRHSFLHRHHQKMAYTFRPSVGGEGRHEQLYP